MQGRKGQDSFRVTKTTASGTVPTRPRPAEVEPPQDVRPSTWIDFNALASTQSRKDVRVQAARASAAARRATLAKKQARRGPHPGSLVFALPTTSITKKAAVADAVRKLKDKDVLTKSSSADQAYFQKLIGIVTQLLERRPLSLEQPRETSLAHSSIRSMLWDAMTSSVTLFQVAIFMAGTHSNTCGLPRSAFRHMGPGLIALRGASLDAIQARITGEDAESIAPIAIALLAGWERRYGDPAAYEVHMKAWKTLALPGKSLEEQNVATLTDLTLEMYRLGLDEQSTTTPSGQTIQPGLMSTLPQGLRIFEMKRAETRSLLALTAQLAQHDMQAKNEIIRLRRIALENMAWSPTHSRSYEPLPELEEQYDPLELNALYHIRAANISICGVILQHTMDLHKVTWTFDLKGGLYIHTASCTHFRTDALLGTKYQDIGLWARFILCSLARDPAQDAFLMDLLIRLDLRSWAHLQSVLERFVYFDNVFGDSCRTLHGGLAVTPGWESYGDLLQTQDTKAREVP